MVVVVVVGINSEQSENWTFVEINVKQKWKFED